MENLYFHIEIWIVYKCLPKCVVANTVNKRVAPLSSHPTHLNPTLNKVTSWVLEIAFPQFCKPLQHLFHFYLFLLKFFFFCTFSFSLFSFFCGFFFLYFWCFATSILNHHENLHLPPPPHSQLADRLLINRENRRLLSQTLSFSLWNPFTHRHLR